MELSKKTTILFPPRLHARLVKLARDRGMSLGNLVRDACEKQYGGMTREDRVAAAKALVGMSLPVGTPEELKREYVADYEDLPE